MGRYHNEFKFNNGIHEQIFSDIHTYLLQEGYEYRNFEGEDVYKKGKGIATGPTFIKIMADSNIMVVEAWIKFAVVPGVYVGESGIEGSYGAIPKSALANRVRYIESIIFNNGGIAIGASKNAPQTPPTQPVAPPAPKAPEYPKPNNAQQPAPQPRPVQQPMQAAPQPQPVQQPAQPAPQTTYSYKFCTQCGTRMDAGAKFCSSCGNPLK